MRNAQRFFRRAKAAGVGKSYLIARDSSVLPEHPDSKNYNVSFDIIMAIS
jgi:hypothetical protein